MNSLDFFERARKVIPGGVNSPVRAFNSVGGTPVFMRKGLGSRITSEDDREFIDFCCSWGALILGHAHPAVVEAVARAAQNGTSFGAATAREVEMAELLCVRVPGLERVRLVNSGTEAAMTAIRLARGFTGRGKILKFDGCYHGHTDSLLVKAGSGVLARAAPGSAGIPPGVVKDTLVAPYNDADAALRLARKHRSDLAAVIVEPVAANMGLVEPQPGFLEALRQACDQTGALLVFDEVITGFRFGPSTYGAIAGVAPDLTCLGKIIGGGLPIGAVGGRAGIMERLAPLGPVYQAGTLSGNPVAVAAGLAALRHLLDNPPYERIARLARSLADRVNALARRRGLTLHCACLGSVFTPFFAPEPPVRLDDVRKADSRAYAAFFHAMLERGVYLPPSPFEVCFVSAAHAEADIEQFAAAASAALAQ